MNLAVSTVVILVALIPGIVFVNAYFAGRFPRELSSLTPLSELALYFFWALPIDGIAFALLHGPVRAPLVDFLGQSLWSQPPSPLPEFITRSLIGTAWMSVVVGYLSVVLVALLAGVLLRRLVWTIRLDTVPVARLLRMKSDWYYTLSGRLQGLPRPVLAEADVMVLLGGEPMLYSGIVDGFDLTAAGDLKELYLTEAKRGRGRGEAFAWKPIPGERFVVLGGTITSVNMRYYEVALKGTPIRVLVWRIQGFLRAFLFEDNY